MSMRNDTTDDPIRCDVLVIGGGPAGSAIAALLAEEGWHVEVLEKDHHPRFRIGESLLPRSMPMLERLGVLPEIDRIGMRKYGAELVSQYDGRSRTLYFARAADGSQPYAYHVRRSDFDQILFKNCIAKGARAHEGIRVRRVEFRPGHTSLIHSEDEQGQSRTWEARFVVDATGRDTFLSSQLGGKERNPHHNSAAVFSHFEGVRRHCGLDEGNISIAWFDHGWFWVIPFKDGVTSVGVVCWPAYLKTRKTDLDRFLWDTIALCPPLAERMKDARMVMPAQAASNFAYQRPNMSGLGYIMIGDAFAFIDPVFSSGVHLALNSAILGAKAVDACLRGSPEYPVLIRDFERKVQRGVSTFSWFIYHFTQPAFRALFMSTRPVEKIEKAVLAMLAGDVFGGPSASLPLFLFKLVYYCMALSDYKNNWLAYVRRRPRASVVLTED
jgi:flavin-dependent dehydrogenase